MDVSNLWALQIMMFLLLASGVVLKRVGILKEEGKGMMTDIVLYFFLPCNIVSSFNMEFQLDILKKFAVVLLVSCLVQALTYTLSRTLYNRKPDGVKRVMQYCTIVSNSGFLGLPIALAIYGTEGMLYASVFIIPMRIMMWSAGIACFTESPDFKTVVKKIAVHPCIVAVYIGLGFMLLRGPLTKCYEAVIAASIPVITALTKLMVISIGKAVASAGSCTTAMTMLLIGMMLAEVDWRSMVDFNTLFISAMRLAVIPAIVLAGCRLAHVDQFLTSVCVLMTSMPAGSTAAILAAKYNCDYAFGTKCVVVSTLLSMISIPIWAMIL
jgi:hypothetical protein